MVLRNVLWCALCLLIAHSTLAKATDKVNGIQTANRSSETQHELKVAKFDYGYVSNPLTIMLWILIASLAKLGEFLITCNR